MLFALLLLLNSAIFAQWVTVDVDTVTRTVGEYRTLHQSLAVDDKGTLFALWADYSERPGKMEFACKSVNGVWSKPVVIADSVVVAAMVVEPQTAVQHIFVRDRINEFHVSHLYHLQRYSDGMETEVVAMDSLRVSPHSAFVDQFGFLHVTWVTETSLRNFRVAYLTNKNGDWQKEIIDSNDAGGFVDIGPRVTLNPQNEVIIAYVNPSFGGSNAYWLFKRYGGNWEINYVPFSGNYFGEQFVDVAVDASSGLHFVVSGWEGEDLFGKTFYFFWTTESDWQGPEELPQSVGPGFVSIQTDHFGNPHLIWERQSLLFPPGDAFYSYKDRSGIWLSQMVVDRGNQGASVFPSFILDNEGCGHLLLSYFVNGIRDSVYVVYMKSQSLVTEVQSEKLDNAIPRAFELTQSYPNPFQTSTIFRYNLNAPGVVISEVFNLSGELVMRFSKAEQQPGEHALAWDGKDRFGRMVSSGIYFFKLQFIDSDGTNRDIGVQKLLKLK